jgi:hypothetical protein
MKTQPKLTSRPIQFALATVAILSITAVTTHSATHRHSVQSQEKESSRSAASNQSTTLNDQTDLNVTVYNSNIALIRDVRQLTVPTGAFRLKFEDIAATVNPATVHFRSLTEPEKLGVIEQNYEYDLLEPAKLLHKYVGKEVTLVRSYMDNGTTKHEEVKATLLADNRQRRRHRNLCRGLSLPRTPSQSFRSPHAAHVPR